MDKISFIDLKSQYKLYKEEIDSSIQNVIDSSAFILGEEVRKLESNLSNYIGSKYCVSCSSGTDALYIVLCALDINPGDEIITTPFSFFATSEVIALKNAKPVFADIEEDSYNIDYTKIEKLITKKTKAIIPVSLYGQPADMEEINKIAEKYNLFVIEDAAQSFGATYKNKKSCNLSQFGCTSFYPAKPLGCYGDGGAVFTNDDYYADKIRQIMNHGQSSVYKHKYIGINGRLDAIQAAVLNVKLKYYDKEIEQRAAVAQKYDDLFKNNSNVISPLIKKDRTSVYAQYSIRIKNREEVVKKLNESGIPTAIHYPETLYNQEALSYLKVDPSKFPVAEKVKKEILSLPMNLFLKEDQEEFMFKKLSEIIK
ncbi:MAG TPA: DegT/DnrJ/EryC1/StrS family aminotransferase [Spirochaetota bacterium]|nr:DegT/DnrJ/EryC1/StrS family aminotransferase [Spirochaetota bacterium]HOS31674.1 DegT/DnrJ/EryC1/StrS family aminotransferase [Spirochaetota bacterium]HOS56061.1 DegT/DnrJ/EryC1/StrS family aminotransferase [Spirochaetota bacterium]HPK61854.1 DegT/DnrJ/EryC1/StrS family aminotransferase [Spirochaetota bacterium]HQF77216.1 DegT/DnrJ/EryC1/StrS family aminotransferase [Spirochaetota bacterium]